MLKALAIALLVCSSLQGQTYTAGFTSINLVDSGRVYKPGVEATHPLYYRPVVVDVWYPAQPTAGSPLLFIDLFALLEARANKYQTETDYSGLVNELAQLYVAELGVGANGSKLLGVQTHTYKHAAPASGKHPVIFYMAGYNGMGFENYLLLEALAQNGFVVVAIASVGRYPGDMTNHQADMLAQVQDAAFVLKHLAGHSGFVNANFATLGVLGCSWGGLSGAVFSNRVPAVQAVASLDGTETHYFGNDVNDPLLAEIYAAGLLHPQMQNVPYLYFESDDKISGFVPTSQYSYYDSLPAEKYYLRFLNSRHEHYVAIPAALQASALAVTTYKAVTTLTTRFFTTYLQGDDTFAAAWRQQLASHAVTDVPFALTGRQANEVVVLEGRVVDEQTAAPLAYVNIGLLNHEVGTVSDTAGHFKLQLHKGLGQDTLRVSRVGYASRQFVVANLLSATGPVRVAMEETTQALDGVVVLTKALKHKRLGNTTQSKFLSTGFGYEQLGAEMGIRVKVKKPTQVSAFNFHISYNRLSGRALFRLNIYKAPKGKPTQHVLNDDVLIAVGPEQTGLITADLTGYDITLTDDALVTLEWVDFVGEAGIDEAIYFSLAPIGNTTYFKKASQAKFKKHSTLGVGFYLDVYR